MPGVPDESRNWPIDAANPTAQGGRTQVYDVKNASGDHSYNITGGVQKRFSARWEGSLFYTYSQARDLQSTLKHPLRRTLPQAQPPLPGQVRPAELKTLNDLTGDKRFKYLGTSQNVIVIQPPA